MPKETLSPKRVKEVLHDLRVHKIELEMQNEELRKTQKELEASRARYFDLYNLAPVGYLTLSKQGVILEANFTTTNLLGEKRGAMVGRPLTHFILFADHATFLERYQRLFETGTKQAFELRLVRRDTSQFWAQMEAAVAVGTDNLSVCFAAIIDITDRKRMEDDLKKAKEAAEDASKAKDQFLAVLSHELRTPLTPVLAIVSSLEAEHRLPDGMPGDLQLIHRNVEMEVRLIDDLLDVTRIARGKIQLHLEVADVHTCVRNAVKICAEEIRGKHLKVVMHLQAGRSHVMGDMARLSQVFWNLLRNAVKFTPEEGRITISTTNIKDRLKIEIADTGIGIEPEALPRIFNAFEQGEKTPSRHFGGLGLGLSIARAVVEMHDGQLTVFSEGMNRGAVFTVELASVPVPAKLPSPTVPAAEPEEKQSLKILMVDDHPDTLGILSRLLRKCGHAVTPATSVETAIRVASQEKFDLLISDIGLPDGSGLDIMQSIKGLYDIRGIALSGYGTDEDFCKSRAAGFDEHLTKPMDIRTLREAIQRVIAPDRSHGKAGTTG